MSKPIDALMQREMTRKEFLATLALATGSILGFSSIIHMLTGKSIAPHLGHSSSMGYGSNAYGGPKSSNL